MEYLQSLEKAITTIENNLGSVTVEEVARAAGYSYYHLTRLFSAVLGEPVGSYIKKRRLADGAQKLLYSDKRVIDIAMENGFESSEAFSRAFKSLYRVSPVVYRKNRLDLIIGAKKQMQPDLLRHIAAGITVRPAIVEMDDIKVAGLRGETTLKNNTIPQLWERFWKIRDSIPNASFANRTFGICESGETIYTMNGDAVFTEVAGIEVECFDNMPGIAVCKTLRAGKYAVFTHTGSLKNLGKTYDYIWGTWILSTHEQIDNREDFEMYDQRYLGFDHPDTQIDLCIPLQ